MSNAIAQPVDTHADEERLRILIVDDDPNELKSLVIGFGLEKFQAEGASSASAALRMLGERDYAVALIDLMMPDMNGLQLARVTRSVFPSVTTVLMSAYHLSPIQLARANAGVVGFVPKPFRFDALVRFVLSKIHTRQNDKQRASVSYSAGHDGGLYCPIEIPEVLTAVDTDITKQ